MIEDQTITVEIPFLIRRRGGRKQVITPDGAPAFAPPRARIDSAMVKALARAFRWRKLLETGAYETIEEMANTVYSLTLQSSPVHSAPWQRTLEKPESYMTRLGSSTWAGHGFTSCSEPLGLISACEPFR